jgi:rhodanese-related sulfurtransferase
MQFVTDNYLPILIALSSGAMLLWSMFGNRIRGVKGIDTQAALQLINHKNGMVLDVRKESEYQSGHALNAKNIPPGKLSERIGELESYRERPIIVMCQNGNRAPDACALLSNQGFTQVYNLTGGIATWSKAKLPLEK